MNRILIGFLTLGLVPLFRMLLGRETPDRRLHRGYQIRFSPFGNPSQAVLKKVLRKFYYSEAELDQTVQLLESRQMAYCKDDEVYCDIIAAIEANGFKVATAQALNMEGSPVIYMSNGYRYVSDFNLCTDCGSRETPAWHDGCMRCGSNDVIIAADLSAKEFEKHVKTYDQAAKAAIKKRKSTRGDDDEDDEDDELEYGEFKNSTQRYE